MLNDKKEKASGGGGLFRLRERVNVSNVTGIWTVMGGLMDERESALGLRSCLTYGLALACDAVYEDGRAAFEEIDTLANAGGVEAVIKVLSRNPESLGAMKENPASVLPGMQRAEMRLMVLQLFLFRISQDGFIRARWPEN